MNIAERNLRINVSSMKAFLQSYWGIEKEERLLTNNNYFFSVTSKNSVNDLNKF